MRAFYMLCPTLGFGSWPERCGGAHRRAWGHPAGAAWSPSEAFERIPAEDIVYK